MKDRIECLSDIFGRIFCKEKYQSAVVFFEWHGPKSFAGNHYDVVEDMSIDLLDITPYKKGYIAPEELLSRYGDIVGIPALLHRGKIDQELIESVQNDNLKVISFEGVVCKSINTFAKEGGPLMCKIKTQKWLDKLKLHCNGDEKLYEKLK